MAAFKQMVQPECGGQNALMQLTNTFTTDGGVKESLGHQKLADIAHHGNQQSMEQQMVSEFLGEQRAVNSFHMNHLLEEIQQVQDHDQRWASEFSQELATVSPNQSLHDTTEILAAEQWAEDFVVNSSLPIEADTQWADEFVSVHSAEQGVREAAADLVSSVQDPQLKETQFMDFMEKLSTGQVSIQDGEVLNQGPESLADTWANEFQKEEGAGDVWGQFQKIWENQFGGEQEEWAQQFAETKNEYGFSEQNPHEGIEKAFEKGMAKLKEGDLPSAILLFESAVRADPSHAEGWQMLGISQADNEMESMAIAALEKCLELEPENLTALMGLAVSYTNELRSSEACDMLKRWITSSPQYSQLGSRLSPARPQSPIVFQPLGEQTGYREVTDVFIAAAQSSPQRVDPQVQVGLGILFNLTREYSKAVDCFNAALQVHPQDAMLWNKLGATLANDNNSGKAVHAYHKALELRPDFVRARYNLGISCINLKAYRESVEHFLSALHFQRSASTAGDQAQLQGSMSESIWSSLRLALMYMGAADLVGVADEKNVELLMEKFKIHPSS